MTRDDFPRHLQFRLPAEWEPHQGTWLTYPHSIGSFYEKIHAARESFVDFVAAVAKGEKVYVNVNDEAAARDLEGRLYERDVRENVMVQYLKTDDSWCRDYCPIFLKHLETGEVAATNWIFNAWGGKYACGNDAQIADKVAKYLEMRVFHPPMILEGGSIDTNGQRVLLTTETCLLNPNRNAHMSREKIEEMLRNYLGIEQVLWLAGTVEGDDTDAHIDNLARFVNENTIVAPYTEDGKDINGASLRENFKLLKQFRDPSGKPFHIVPLPTPEPLIFHNGRLPASYANFYIANDAVIVPTFGCSQDKVALRILQELFVSRPVIGIDARNIVIGQGAFHCLSMQIPK